MVAKVADILDFAKRQPRSAPFRIWSFAYDMFVRNKTALSLTQAGSSYRPICGQHPSRITKLRSDCLISADVRFKLHLLIHMLRSHVPLLSLQPLKADNYGKELPCDPPMCNGAAAWTLACLGARTLSVPMLFQYG